MLEKLDFDVAVSKAEYRRRLPGLQRRLYDLEHALFQARIPVMVVIEGWAASGKGSTISTLAERLDPRGFRVVPITPPRTAEQRFPWLHRFWLRLPGRGQMVVFDTSWYRRVLGERLDKTVRGREIESAFHDIQSFEEQLASDGTVLIKFWLHISRKEQSRRFRKLLKDKTARWQVSDEDALQHEHYKRYHEFIEETLARTDFPHAPWVIVAAADKYHTRLAVLEALIRALESRLPKPSPQPPPPSARPSRRTKAIKKNPPHREVAHA
jgi:polyphosphate kinase 2 (PPK2 family)